MRGNELMDAITELDDVLLNEAAKAPSPEQILAAKRARRRPLIFRMAAAAAAVALALLLVPVFTGRETPGTLPSSSEEKPNPGTEELLAPTGSEKARLIAQPVYPEEWAWQQVQDNPVAREPSYGRHTSGMEAADLYRGFFGDMMLLLLSDQEEKSAVMSPVNIFMATAMLAEITDGQTRQEILNAHGVSDIEQLRDQAAKIWGPCYKDDGREKTILGNSLWLSGDLPFHEGTVKQLADHYYASSFTGEMGSQEYDRLLQKWLTDMTGGLLRDQTESIQFASDTTLALFSTVLFQTKWNDEFSKQSTKAGTFHAPSGDTEAQFMSAQHDSTLYYTADGYRFASRWTRQSQVWFFLPDEGVSVSEMMQKESFREFVSTRYDARDYYVEGRDGNYHFVTAHGVTPHSAWVNLTVPKLDVSCEIDLTDAIRKMGVKTAFANGEADYSAITDQQGVFLRDAVQDTRFVMDEEGISAASYVEYLAGEPVLDEEIDFICDRPFFLLVTGAGEMPLFAGVVNEP